MLEEELDIFDELLLLDTTLEELKVSLEEEPSDTKELDGFDELLFCSILDDDSLELTTEELLPLELLPMAVALELEPSLEELLSPIELEL